MLHGNTMQYNKPTIKFKLKMFMPPQSFYS